MKVELLILAHDAHTCAYDMEGISSVLRACRSCALQLAEVAHYPLMVSDMTPKVIILLMTAQCDSI